MFMKFRKSLILIASLVIITVLSMAQYKRINNNAPKGYIIKKNKIGEEIVLDDLAIKFLGFDEDLEEDLKQTRKYNVLIELRNISDKKINCMDILYSKLSLGVYNVEYAQLTGDIKKVKELKPNEKVEVILSYVLEKKAMEANYNESFVFYINPLLYKNKVEEVYKNQNKFYSKSVILGGIYNEKKKK